MKTFQHIAHGGGIREDVEAVVLWRGFAGFHGVDAGGLFWGCFRGVLRFSGTLERRRRPSRGGIELSRVERGLFVVCGSAGGGGGDGRSQYVCREQG